MFAIVSIQPFQARSFVALCVCWRWRWPTALGNIVSISDCGVHHPSHRAAIFRRRRRPVQGPTVVVRPGATSSWGVRGTEGRDAANDYPFLPACLLDFVGISVREEEIGPPREEDVDDEPAEMADPAAGAGAGDFEKTGDGRLKITMTLIEAFRARTRQRKWVFIG